MNIPFMADIPVKDGTMTVATSTFRWSKRYSVNVAELDRQHQGLFAIVNELNDALVTGEGAAVINSVLRRLVEYTRNHFAAEEALMTQHRFPALLTHCAEHDKFTRLVAKFVEDYRTGKSGVSVSLLLFLQNWLKEHVLVSDKAYSSFLNTQGVR